jgi:hypothetical protein
MGRMRFEVSLGKQFMRTHFQKKKQNKNKNSQSKIDWRCGSSSKPALQVWNPEFKIQSHQNQKSLKSETNRWWKCGPNVSTWYKWVSFYYGVCLYVLIPLSLRHVLNMITVTYKKLEGFSIFALRIKIQISQKSISISIWELLIMQQW